jgi:FAD-dependent oxidoreductase family protein
MTGGWLDEPPRRVPVAHDADVLVVGGGPAGIGATIGAARAGARTLLVEKQAFLGGVATAVMMTTWNVPSSTLSGVPAELLAGLLAEHAAVDGGPTIPFDPETFKDVAERLCLEAGVALRYYTSFSSPILSDAELGSPTDSSGSRSSPSRTLAGVVVESKSGREAITARVVVDATGDGDLAASAGVPYVKGRETDGKMRPLTVLFRLGGVDLPRVVDYARAHPDQFTADPNFQILDLDRGLVRISGFFDLIAAARERGELDRDCHYLRFEGVLPDRGTLFVNTTRVYGADGTSAADLTRATIEARRQMADLLRFITAHVPGCERAFRIDASPVIGVRETRHIRGQHVLTEEEILDGATYPDTVVNVWRHHGPGRNWHSPDGGEGAAWDPTYRTMTTGLVRFGIPYRALVPLGVDGLLVAGRAISQTHEADMWTRGMYCCAMTGQCAGAAAAIAARRQVLPRAIDVGTLRAELARQGLDVGSAAPAT